MLPAHFYPIQAAMNKQIIAYSKPENKSGKDFHPLKPGKEVSIECWKNFSDNKTCSYQIRVATRILGRSLQTSPCSNPTQKRGATRKQRNRFRELMRLRTEKRLTDCLEILEQLGIHDDEAIFFLSSFGGKA